MTLLVFETTIIIVVLCCVISAFSNSVDCPPFELSLWTMEDCYVEACSDDGGILSASLCESCSGDTFLTLLSADRSVVKENDDYCGSCSQLQYTISPTSMFQCQIVTVQQKCFEASECSGSTTVSSSTMLLTLVNVSSFEPTLKPTAQPSTKPPTFLPTRKPTQFPTWKPTEAPTALPTVLPTQKPSFRPTTSYPSFTPTFVPTASPTVVKFNCPTFVASNTNSGSENTVPCNVWACGSDTILFDMCYSASGSLVKEGDPVLSIFDSLDNLLASSSDYAFPSECGNAPYFSFTLPGSPSKCRIYTIKQGCHGMETCGGTLQVSNNENRFTHVPTLEPSLHPSVLPSLTPTQTPSMEPTTSIPTMMPTIRSQTWLCPKYTSSPTTLITADCFVQVCGGDSISIELCSDTDTKCSGNVQLSLSDPAGNVLDTMVGCDACPSLTYKGWGTSTTCSTMKVRQSCPRGGSCASEVIITSETGQAKVW